MRKTEKDFLEDWRKYYVAMVDGIQNCIRKELQSDVVFYMEKNPPKYGVLKRFIRKALSVVFRLEDGYWEKNDKDLWKERELSTLYSVEAA